MGSCYDTQIFLTRSINSKQYTSCQCYSSGTYYYATPDFKICHTSQNFCDPGSTMQQLTMTARGPISYYCSCDSGYSINGSTHACQQCAYFFNGYCATPGNPDCVFLDGSGKCQIDCA